MLGTDFSNQKLKTGNAVFDGLLVSNSIVTIKCTSSSWLFSLISNLVVRNLEPAKNILYMHWVDYHKRYWTIDIESLYKIAKTCNVRTDLLNNNLLFLRAFSRDNNDVAENWQALSNFRNLNLILLDSVDELYEEKKQTNKPLSYALGKFLQVCVRNNATGIIFHRSPRPLNYFLRHISSVILDLSIDQEEVKIEVLKHTSQPDQSISLPRNNQYKLRRWL